MKESRSSELVSAPSASTKPRWLVFRVVAVLILHARILWSNLWEENPMKMGLQLQGSIKSPCLGRMIVLRVDQDVGVTFRSRTMLYSMASMVLLVASIAFTVMPSTPGAAACQLSFAVAISSSVIGAMVFMWHNF